MPGIMGAGGAYGQTQGSGQTANWGTFANGLRGISGDNSALTMLANLISSKKAPNTTGSNVGSVLGSIIDNVQATGKAMGDGKVKASVGDDRPKSLYNTLMEIAAGGADASTGGATGNNPYHVAVRVLQHQYAQSGAQTEQNIADVGSWFGQYQGDAQHAAKSNRKAGKHAAKDAAKFSGSILSGIADPNVAASVAQDANNTQRYLGKSNASENRFDNRMVADASRQESYYKMVEQRLGAQEQSGIRDQIAMAKAQQSAYAQQQGGAGGQFDDILSVLRLLPQNERTKALGVPGAGGGFDTDARSGLASALSGASQLGEDPSTKMPSFGYQNFNDLLSGLQHGASAGGFDLNNPQIRDAYRQWIAANLLPLWNKYQGGPDYQLQGKSFLEK